MLFLGLSLSEANALALPANLEPGTMAEARSPTIYCNVMTHVTAQVLHTWFNQQSCLLESNSRLLAWQMIRALSQWLISTAQQHQWTLLYSSVLTPGQSG